MAVALSTIIFSPLSASPNSGAAVTDTPTSVRVTAAVAPESSALRGPNLPESSDRDTTRSSSGDVARSVTLAVRGAERCKSARTAAVFFRLRTWTWQELRDGRLATRSPVVAGKACHWAKFAAATWRARASSARRSYWRWLDDRTLEDFRVTPGRNAWFQAVSEAQRAYPGTAWWLKSCSASEGGWGRWVPNSDGAPPGGWMQMYESTFWRMWGTAWRDVTARGFRVPRSAHSWYSPLGQALASAWGLTNGRRGEWNSSGC